MKMLHCSNAATATNIRSYRANFSVSPLVCSIAWTLLVEYSPEIGAKASQDHFLWGCMILKTYTMENDMASKLGGIDKKCYGNGFGS